MEQERLNVPIHQEYLFFFWRVVSVLNMGFWTICKTWGIEHVCIYHSLHQDKYIVYRPLKKLAFIANAALVNLIVHVQEDSQQCISREKNKESLQFLESLGFWTPEPPFPPTLSVDHAFQPTIATLFLTTACNLRWNLRDVRDLLTYFPELSHDSTRVHIQGTFCLCEARRQVTP